MRKGEELLFCLLHKIIIEIACFSVIVRQCNIAFSVVHVHVQVCFSSFLFLIIFVQGSGQLDKGLFVHPLGLYE